MTTLAQEKSLNETLATLHTRLDELIEFIMTAPKQGQIDRVYRAMNIANIDNVLDDIARAIDEK